MLDCLCPGCKRSRCRRIPPMEPWMSSCSYHTTLFGSGIDQIMQDYNSYYSPPKYWVINYIG